MWFYAIFGSTRNRWSQKDELLICPHDWTYLVVKLVVDIVSHNMFYINWPDRQLYGCVVPS